MSNKPVTDNLKKLLADSYALMIKTHNYHWNVEGESFNGLHALFMTQYTELFMAVDVIAERIRALGEKAPGSPSQFAKLSAIKDGDSDADSATMLKNLYQSQQEVLATLKTLRQKAEKADDQVTVDLCVERTGVHEKAAWMLKSSLPAAHRAKL